MWMRADSKSGYVCEFEVYEGKKGDKVEKGLGAQAVMALTEHIHGRYHHVYCDNFFTGVDLFLDLLRKQTYAWGTIRPHRRGFPSDFKPLLKKGLLNREDSRTVQNGYLTVSIWQDTKPICCAATNASPNAVVPVTRKLKNGSRIQVSCPEAIQMYNKSMGGVDHNDQLRCYYTVRMKSRKFYKYLFWATFVVCLTNAFVLCCNFTELGISSVKDFHVALAKDLIAEYNSRKKRGRPSITSPPPQRFCNINFPVKREKKGHRCHYCSNYLHTRRETIWYCEDCNLHLCHTGREDDCFRLYHNRHGPNVISFATQDVN